MHGMRMPPRGNCSAAWVEERWSWHACCVEPRVSSPVLVGRSGELSALDTALAEAGRGSPLTVIVEGEAGVGKSRLVSEFGEPARADDAHRLGARPLSDGIALLARRARIPLGEPGDMAGARAPSGSD